jgi:hypothetical protein
MPRAAGALMRVTDGKVRVIDGPTAEAKELVGGDTVINAASKGEAIRLGAEFMELHAPVLGPPSRASSRSARCASRAAAVIPELHAAQSCADRKEVVYRRP